MKLQICSLCNGTGKGIGGSYNFGYCDACDGLGYLRNKIDLTRKLTLEESLMYLKKQLTLKGHTR